MVFEAHCMSFPCTELLLFNYAKVKTVFHSMAPLKNIYIYIYIYYWLSKHLLQHKSIKHLGCVYTGRKKSDLLPISDTDRNLMHVCKHKNPHEIRFFCIRSEPFPNVVLNQIHIRYLDIRPMSKHTYPILHRTPNARVTCLLINIFNGLLMRSHFIEMENLYR